MTRMELIKAQLMELTPSEREELVHWIDHISESPNDESRSEGFEEENDGSLTPEQRTEIDHRIAEFEAGTSVIEDKATFFRLLGESLQERRL